MSIANTGKMQRRPAHPGEMLREDFLPDYGLTASGLAGAIGVSRQSVNELLRGRRAVSPEMALCLGKLFGNSSAFWLNAQRAVDLWDAAQAIQDDVAGIKTLNVAEHTHPADGAPRPTMLDRQGPPGAPQLMRLPLGFPGCRASGILTARPHLRRKYADIR
jgi:antitoxin HigA-1